MRDESLNDFVTESLRARLAEESRAPAERGWRRVFGQADPQETAEFDELMAGEFNAIDLETPSQRSDDSSLC